MIIDANSLARTAAIMNAAQKDHAGDWRFFAYYGQACSFWTLAFIACGALPGLPGPTIVLSNY